MYNEHTYNAACAQLVAITPRNVYETFLFGLSENVTRQTFFEAF